MAVDVVIQCALNYAHACGRDHRGQDELALRALQNVRPEWSEIEALSTVDWVRPLRLARCRRLIPKVLDIDPFHRPRRPSR